MTTADRELLLRLLDDRGYAGCERVETQADRSWFIEELSRRSRVFKVTPGVGLPCNFSILGTYHDH